MPRTGWLAAGAAIAALTVGAEDRHLVGVLVAVAGCLLLLGLWPPHGRRVAPVALAIWMCRLGLRAGVGPAGAVLRARRQGGGPWTMVVETVGSPREGHQVATNRTEPEALAGSGSLPRYRDIQSIEPGDRITVAGRGAAETRQPELTYLERLDAWGTLEARSMEGLERPIESGTSLERWRREAGGRVPRELAEPEAGLAAGYS